ncbi:LuxR family transcriptional regulator [Agromyces sp. Root81]|uniref:response regulator transcription factor n=1 Tax=Agromyces sp. Root81 TaxID=1736601 RepID=UPI000701FDA0|nr:response regulator transcription factor [Agromyces sp. Root81]KRC61733.1 LuxR family transcriptional regulator [Agromyces sp. Root81]
MSRIVVVDDHPVFRKGLVALLRASDFEVVGEASSGTEAIAVVLDTRPDLVLMDLGLPELGGVAATERIVAELPEVPVVVITLYDDEQSVRAALQAGASGYVVKQAPPEQIIAAIEAALAGALWIGAGVPRPGFGGSAPEPHAMLGLTPRETAIAELMSRGLANPVIAERLHLSTKTVANYVSLILVKLGADDRRAASRIVRESRDARE